MNRPATRKNRIEGQGMKNTIEEYWNDVRKHLPPEMPVEVVLSMKSFFFTGAWAFECLMMDIIQNSTESGDLSAGMIRASLEIKQTLDTLDEQKAMSGDRPH
jgi:hypothetical protein